MTMVDSGWVRLALAALLGLHGVSAGANPGEDGDQVFSSGTVVVNAYAALNLTANAGATSVRIAEAATLALPAAACPSSACTTALQAGDLLMLYQPQGASISTGNSASYGGVSDYGSSGLYEFIYVTSVTTGGGNRTINFSSNANGTPCNGLRNTYTLSTASGVAPPMLIRVPQYRNLTVNAGASLVAAPWNWSSGSTGLGGVLVVDVRDNGAGTGVVTINGNLSASGRGFRGGTDDPSGGDTDNNASGGYRNTVAGSEPNAEKGESIAGSVSRYDGLGGRFGRGAPANGGGGGAGHNGAGGGGSNAGATDNSSSFGGSLGVPDLSGSADPGNGAGYFQAWCLDPVIGNGTTSCASLTQSNGGGRGGYTWALYWAPSPFTVAPGNTAWGSSGENRRYNFGGLGGRPLDAASSSSQRNQSYARLFFGGGGGAGDANNGGGTGNGWAGTGCGGTGGSHIGAPPNNGGNGGGLVYVITNRVQGSGSIQADGAAGEESCGVSGEGPGGGGGGGTVVITTGAPGSPLPGTLSVSARGGDGGDQTNADTSRGVNCASSGTDCEVQGGGGGGGGGVIMAPTGGSKVVAGGFYGITMATTMEGIISGSTTGRFYPNGATTGASGQSLAPPPRTGDSSPFSCLDGPGFTTPVTLAWVQATAEGGAVQLRFATAAEAGNAGFRVVAGTARGKAGSGVFIPSRVGFSDSGQDYSAVLPADTSEVHLVDVDLQGRERWHGPFQVGRSHGEPIRPQPYDWQVATQQRAQHQASLRGSVVETGKLTLSRSGMYRVSQAQLQAAGVNLSGVPVDEIAVVGRNGPISRAIEGPRLFGAESAIVFFGEAQETLWSRDSHYLVRREPVAVRQMPFVAHTVAATPVSTRQVVLEHAPQNGYDPASPVGDPWYAQRLLAQNGAQSAHIVLEGPPPLDGQAELEVLLWGGIAYDQATPDHSVRVLVNGQEVAQERWHGISTQAIQLPLQLSSLPVTVTIEASGDTGHPVDIINLERVRLSYRAQALSEGSHFLGERLQPLLADTIHADSFGDATTFVHGSVSVGNVGPGPLRAFSVNAGDASEIAVSRSGSVATLYAESILPDSLLWVGSAAQLLSPAIAPVRADADLLQGPAQWLVISHGMFIPALADLVALRQSEGLSTRVVDVEQVFARYSAGNPDPQAIARYIAEASAAMDTRYVLLVGADTVDAPGHLGSGSLSFVPTPYVATNRFVQYAPADALLGDVDGDGIAEVAVGRLPVRTLAEAAEMVRKIRAYDQQPAHERVLLVAGPDDGSASFSLDSEWLEQGLGPLWQRNRVYQNELGLDAARAALVQGFDSGQSLISYTGHSGPNRWTFDPLFTTSQIDGSHANPALRLAQNDNQPIVLQFACWTTYFVSAQQNSMAQVLLTTAGRGASAVIGASVLMEQTSHQRMATAIRPHLQAGTRIGDALLAARASIAADPQQPYKREIQAAVAILGDPAQRVR